MPRHPGWVDKLAGVVADLSGATDRILWAACPDTAGGALSGLTGVRRPGPSSERERTLPLAVVFAERGFSVAFVAAPHSRWSGTPFGRRTSVTN
jgi:hypothetical protein